MADLFGFSITRVKKDQDSKQHFSIPTADDGATTVNAVGGAFGQFLDLEGNAKNEADLIRRYREISLHPECDSAIDDIVNEAIVVNENKDSVHIDLSNLTFGKEVRRKIEEEFKNILLLLDFNTRGHDIFRRWYVDGRMYYQKIIDRENPRNGIVELKYIDPRKIKKVREVKKVDQVLVWILLLSMKNTLFLMKEEFQEELPVQVLELLLIQLRMLIRVWWTKIEIKYYHIYIKQLNQLIN